MLQQIIIIPFPLVVQSLKYHLFIGVFYQSPKNKTSKRHGSQKRKHQNYVSSTARTLCAVLLIEPVNHPTLAEGVSKTAWRDMKTDHCVQLESILKNPKNALHILRT